MRRISATLTGLATAAALTVAPVIVVAPAASAAGGTPGCITKAEFGAVKMGMTLRKARQIIGAQGRTTSSNTFSDGDTWRTIDFRQCRRTWAQSSVSIDFESTEKEEWVEDWYCDSSGCEDWGGFETVYTMPLRVSGKYAYWR